MEATAATPLSSAQVLADVHAVVMGKMPALAPLCSVGAEMRPDARYRGLPYSIMWAIILHVTGKDAHEVYNGTADEITDRLRRCMPIHAVRLNVVGPRVLEESAEYVQYMVHAWFVLPSHVQPQEAPAVAVAAL